MVPSTHLQPLVAPLLLGRYRPVALLARGGSSLVYRGTDETLGRPVAIKVFRAGVDVDRYYAELRLLSRLNHHGVVSITEAGIDHSTPDDPRPFLVMELVRGNTVRNTMHQRILSARDIGELGYEVAEALDYVHAQGVIHRDISPSNIILTDAGTSSSRPRARLADFGIAIDVTMSANEPGRVTGTAAYLSPEQARNGRLTSATDIYSLGLVMLECFTSTKAFPGPPIESALARLHRDPEIRNTVPRQWRTLIASMTQQDAIERPVAAELTKEFRRLLRTSR